MRKQIEDGSADFKAGMYVACERCVCELAESMDEPKKAQR
jgi:hypothetical protein